MNKILLIATGGTIAMTKDEQGRSVPAFSGDDLLAEISDTFSPIEWKVINFSNVASCNMSPEMMLALSKEIRNSFQDPNLSGIIITHGTDTLEETAYFLDLTIDDPRPVILTGAQRDASVKDNDGPRNLKNALLIALGKDAQNRGVLVSFSEEIYAARDVRKLHTSQLYAFSAGNNGALGYVDGYKVFWNRKPAPTVKLGIPQRLANVPICKIYTGMMPQNLQYLADMNIDGLVLEAFGRGNVPPSLVPFIEHTISQGIPVVLTSRCLFGNCAPIYGYPGGGADLERVGAWFAGDLSTEKTRLLMSIALGLGLPKFKLKELLGQRGVQGE